MVRFVLDLEFYGVGCGFGNFRDYLFFGGFGINIVSFFWFIRDRGLVFLEEFKEL